MDTPNTTPESNWGKKVIIATVVVALGAVAYFLSNAGLFQGRLQLDQGDVEKANEQLANLGESISFPEGFAFQPPEAGGTKMTFETNDDIIVDLAPSKGTMRWMKADFDYEVNGGVVTVTNTSKLHNTELMVVCVAFSGAEAADCHSKFDNNLDQSFVHEYAAEGTESFTFTVVDPYDNSDQIIKEFVVEGIEDDLVIDEPAPVVPLKLEVSEDVNGVVVVKDVTESYTDGVDQTRLYCDANVNEQMDFYVHDDEVVDQFRDAKPLNVIRTEGVECTYPSNGTYNITYQTYINGSHSGDARLVLPVTINHAEDLDEPVEPPVSVNAKILTGWETPTSLLVYDVTENVNDIAYAVLQCKEGGVSYVFSNDVLSEEQIDAVQASIPNSEIASNFNWLAGQGFACAYPEPGNEPLNYEIIYNLFDVKGRIIGSTNESVVVEAEAVDPNALVASIGIVPPNAQKVVRVFDESYNMGEVSSSKLYCGIDGEVPEVFENRADVDQTLYDIATYGVNCDYSAQPAGIYTIRYELYDGANSLIGHDEEQVEILAEPLAFIPNLADYLQADVFNASPDAEVIPAGAVVAIEFACTTEPGTFTIATTQDPARVATFNIIPAENCGERNIQAPAEEPAEVPAPAPVQPAPVSSGGGGGGGSHSASELTTTCEITPENPVVGQTVSFESSDVKIEVVNGSWDFGDDKEVYKFNASKNESVDVEHIYDKAGKYKVKLTLKNTQKTYACKKTITVDAAADRVACNDNIDNDKDGFKDLDDPGCDDENDKDEVNSIPRSGRQCNDGEDNDGDGFVDLDDIGCQNAFDNDEENPLDVILEGGDPAQQACLNKSENAVSFADTEDNFARDVIDNFAAAFYDGGDSDTKGDFIVRGYKSGSKSFFKGDQPIRRDEALKILSISSCLFEQSNAENNTQEVNYKDPEFSNKDYWARNFIYRAANQGIIKKAEFMHPGDSVTRAEFAKMLAMVDKNIRGTKIAKCERDEELAGDLDFTHWGCGYFKTLDQLGIAGAIKDSKGNTRLYPNEILDRTSAVIWLNNYIAVINQ